MSVASSQAKIRISFGRNNLECRRCLDVPLLFSLDVQDRHENGKNCLDYLHKILLCVGDLTLAATADVVIGPSL